MSFTRRENNGIEDERLILTGSITCTPFCRRLFSRVEKPDLDNEACSVILSWVEEYYHENQEAPGKEFQFIFDEKSKSPRPEMKEIIKDVLSRFSEQYDEDEMETAHNDDFLWKKTCNYLRSRMEDKAHGTSQDLREMGKHDQANRVMKELGERIAKLEKSDNDGPFSISMEELKPLSMKELFSKKKEEKMWLWGEILSRDGLGMTVAKPKDGKTTFALNLAISVAIGKPFLGIPTVETPVIYLALEESENQVRRTLEEMKIDEETENFFIWFGMAPNSKDLVEKIDKMILEFKAGLVIIDPLQKLLRIRDGNAYAEVTNGLEPYNQIARKRICNIHFTHHSPKMEREGVDNVLGSTAHSGGVDTIIVLKKRQRPGTGESIRVITTVQRYGRPIEEEIVICLNDRRRLFKEGTLTEMAMEEVMKYVFEVLQEQESISQGMIISDGKFKPNLIVQTMKWAVEKGSVLKEGSGRKGDAFRYRFPSPPVVKISRLNRPHLVRG